MPLRTRSSVDDPPYIELVGFCAKVVAEIENITNCAGSYRVERPNLDVDSVFAVRPIEWSHGGTVSGARTSTFRGHLARVGINQ